MDCEPPVPGRSIGHKSCSLSLLFFRACSHLPRILFAPEESRLMFDFRINQYITRIDGRLQNLGFRRKEEGSHDVDRFLMIHYFSVG